MSTEVGIFEPGNQPSGEPCDCAIHCTNMVLFTVKLAAMNGDKCKSSNGLAQDFDGLRVKARSENECGRILGFAIVRFLPPVRFVSNASPSWRRFIHECGSSVGTVKDAPAVECNPVRLAHRTGVFSWQTPGMKWKRQARFTSKPLRSNDSRTARLQTPNTSKPSQHSRSTLMVMGAA